MSTTPNKNHLSAGRPHSVFRICTLMSMLLLLMVSSCKKGSPGNADNPGNEPQPQSGADAAFLSVSTSELNTMAIDIKNVLWAAGDNRGAVSGLGNKNKNIDFIRVVDQVKSVSVSDSRSMIIKSDNSVWTAGNNDFGELGIGSAVSDGKFVKVADGAEQIEAGWENGFIVKSDHTLWASGFNHYQIFNSNYSLADVSDTYQKIADNVQAISAGQAHFLMLKTDGSLWACGQNVNGH